MISRYTPLAVCSGNITNNIYSVDFGKLAPSADVVEVTGASTAKVFDWEKPIVIDAPYGACLSVVASGASSSVITIDGFDYLGQPVTEEVTLNGTTAVAGNKCFKYISKILKNITSNIRRRGIIKLIYILILEITILNRTSH